VDIAISWRASSSNQKLICGQADPDFMKIEIDKSYTLNELDQQVHPR